VASHRQTKANRSNAQRSTGPVTAEGKRRSCTNATTHGLTARLPLLPGEDEAAFLQLREALHRDLDPEGALMEQWIEEIVVMLWRLQRCGHIEVAIYEYHRLRLEAVRARGALNALRDTLTKVDELLEVTSSASRDLAALDACSEAIATGPALLGQIASLDAVEGDALGKLSRHEERLRRHLRRALEVYWELRWRLPLQGVRRQRSGSDWD